MREFNARSKTHGSQISLARHQNRKLKNQNKNTVKRDKNHYAKRICERSLIQINNSISSRVFWELLACPRIVHFL